MTNNITPPPPKKMGFSEKGKTLDPVSIIRSDCIKQGANPDDVIQKLAQLLQDPHYNLVQFGNTIFLLHLVQPYTVELHIFTTDNIMGLMNALKEMIDMAKKEGVKKGYSYSDQLPFKQAIERSGLPIKITPTTRQIGTEMKPVYLYEMDL